MINFAYLGPWFRLSRQLRAFLATLEILLAKRGLIFKRNGGSAHPRARSAF